MSNSSTHPVLWDEATVIEDKDGKRYSWALPHGFRGSQHLMTWGRKLLCGQQGSMGGGMHDRPFGSERACKVCIRIALKLVEQWEAKQAAPVNVEFTREQLADLHLLINRARQGYQSDHDYWNSRFVKAAEDDPNLDTIKANWEYTERLANKASETLRDLVVRAQN